jgi:hypothetical protein
VGLGAFAALVVVSIGIGVAVQLLQKRKGYDWLIIAVTGTFGAYFASETFPGSTTFEGVKNWGPGVDGFYLIPGIVTGALLALVAYFGSRRPQMSAGRS